MKKQIITFLCMALVTSMIFSSCSSKGKIVMSYGDAYINENMFIYILALGKTQQLQSLGRTADDPALWNYDVGGKTLGELTYLDQQMDMKVKLFFADHALQNGGELTKEEKQEITLQIDNIIEQFGTKAALNKYLETYSMNAKLLEDYYELEALYNKGMAMAFSEGGKYEVPVEDAMKYYRNNFVTIKHIAIGTEYAGTDEDGNYIYYTEEEKEQRRKIIDEIIAGLENGGDWDDYAAISEDNFHQSNPYGYTITKGVLGTSMYDYEKVAFSLKEGEWGVYEMKGTCVYIIKRVPLLESDFRNCYSNIMTTLIEAAATQTALDNDASFTVDKEIIDSYNISAIPIIK